MPISARLPMSGRSGRDSAGRDEPKENARDGEGGGKSDPEQPAKDGTLLRSAQYG
jgi:hypothetical protein